MKFAMTKKIVAVIMAITFVITSAFIGAFSVFADGSVSYTFDEESGLLTITGTGAMDDYDENSLTTIPWYSFRSDVRNVVIENGITSVGDYALCRMINLESITIPDSVTRLGAASLAGADSLKSITVPSTVTEIGDYAFGYSYDMSLTDGFVTYCDNKTAAQAYCFKSYVPFETPFDASGVDNAVITGSNNQDLWSFTPKANGTITFWSTGGQDTFGLIYDANNYIYNEKFAEMQKSALKIGDDEGENCNFKITFNATANTRYYLAAKFMSASKTSGGFEVRMTFSCDEHNYELISDTATCTSAGVASYACTACGATKTENTQQLAHTPKDAVVENRTESTCVAKGSYDEVVYCQVCQTEISRSTKELEYAEHQYSVVDTVEATCTSQGYTTYECAVCLDRYDGDFTELAEHTPGEAVRENVVDASCTEDGSYDEVVRCIACQEVLSSTPQVIEAAGHQYGATVVNPTCSEDGYTFYLCAECGDYYVDDITTKLPHTPGQPVNEDVVKETCTVDGSYNEVIRCTVCESIIESTPKTVQATGHNYVHSTVAPTCTKNGAEIDTCSKCGDVISDPIPAPGHNYAAIDFADGVVGAVCANCDKYKTVTFMDYLNQENDLLDIATDGIVNAKDYAKFRKEFPAPDVVCDIDLTAGTVSRDNAVLEDGVLTLTPAGRYSTFVLTGDTDSITIVVNAANDAEIKLANANITADSKNAITINNVAADGIVPTVGISASEGTSNSITTTTTGNAVSNYSNSGACKLEVKGHGTLVLNTASTAINSGGKIEIKNITLDITSGNRGIDTKFTNAGVDDYASIDIAGNANITIKSTDDGIRCKNLETKALADGDVDTIININAGGDGIQLEGKKSALNSGNITITANGYAFNCAAANFKINSGATVDATGKKGYSK